MTKDEFIKALDAKGYSHSMESNKVVVTHCGHVSLPILTTLPEGTKFENGGSVSLPSLTGVNAYMGRDRKFTYCDGFTMIVSASRKHGEFMVHSARFFGGGPVSRLHKCFVVESGNLCAHGASVKAAIDDLKYKLAENADKAEIAADIRESGKVTLAQFRALTGACREGIRHHLAGLGVSLDSIEDMPLAEALNAMSGTSFGDAFRKHLGEAA